MKTFSSDISLPLAYNDRFNYVSFMTRSDVILHSHNWLYSMFKQLHIKGNTQDLN
jgi:hypothetical protein